MALLNLPASVSNRSTGWRVWAALWIVYIVWGSTYLAIRVVVETMPPLLSASLRFVLAGLIMFGILAYRRGRAGIKVGRREVVASTIIGSLLLLGANGLVMIAEQTVPSGLAALLIASVPLWVILLRTISRDRVGKATLGAVGVGFIGVGILVLPGNRPEGVGLFGPLLLIAASASWATGSFLSRRLTLPRDPLVSTALQMICGGAVMGVAALLRGEAAGLDPARFSLQSWLALGYLVVFGSLLAFTAYVWLLQNAPISKVATYAYVNPVVAIFLGWLILSESIGLTMLLGAAIIVGSVAFTVGHEVSQRKTEPDGEPDGEIIGSAPALAVSEAS